MRQRLVIAALLLLSAVPVGVRAANDCDAEGAYYAVSNTKVDGKRVIALVSRRWPNGVPVLDVVVESDAGGNTVATGELDEYGAGRWRVRHAAVPPDEIGLRLRLKRCERFVGRIKAPGKTSRRVVARRVTCGDGRVDAFAGEDCEPGGDACAAGTCTDRCACQGSGGQLDPTFGSGGVARIGGPPFTITCAARSRCPSGVATSIHPAADGTMLVVGWAPDRFGDIRSFDRLRADGTLDPTFHASPLGGTAPLVDVMPDGRVTWVQANPAGAQAARRFAADGAGDPTFVAQPGRIDEVVTAVAATADGGIVAIGNGTITTWAADGAVQFVDLPAGWTPVAVDDAARIVALRSESTLQLGRFLASGSPDPTFAGGGPVCITATPPSTETAVVPLNDGSMIVGVPMDAGYRLTRVPTSGSGLDATCTTDPTSIVAPIVPRFVQPDGKYIGASSGIVRLLPDGTLDLDFGRLGTIEVPGGYAALAMDTEGRILVGGVRYNGDTDRVVRRYLP